LREIGRLEEAYPLFERAARGAAALAASNARYAETRDAANADLASIESRIARIRVALEPADDAARAHVAVDGRALPSEALGLDVVVVPPRAHVHVVLPDRAPIDRDVDVTAGSRQTVRIALDTIASTPPRPPAPVHRAPTRTQPSPSAPPALAWIGLSTAIAGGAVFGVFWALAQSRYDEASTFCRPVCVGDFTGTPLDATISAGRAFEIVAYAGLGLAIAGTATAIVAFALPRGARAHVALARHGLALAF
jgi:hypothetical protein